MRVNERICRIPWSRISAVRMPSVMTSSVGSGPSTNAYSPSSQGNNARTIALTWLKRRARGCRGQVARRRRGGAQALAARRACAIARLELIEGDQPLAQQQIAQAVVGVPGEREDDPALVDVDLLRDPARGQVQHAGRPAAAEVPQQVGDAEALEPAVDEARGEARFVAFVHALSPVGRRPIIGSRPVPGTPGPIRGRPTPSFNLGPLRNRSRKPGNCRSLARSYRGAWAPRRA